MYKTITICLTGYILASCQNTTLNSSRETIESADKPIVVDQRRVSEPSLNFQVYHKKALALTQAEMRDQIQEHRQLESRLAELSPISIPSIGVKPAIGLAEADKRYRAFVSDQANNPVLPLFQQRYARFILTEYALLETTEWPLLAYYTDQLLTSQSFDYTTITRSLVRLHNHIPFAQFSALQARALDGATARLQVENQAISATENMISKAEQRDKEGKLSPMEKLMLDGHRRLVKKFKDEALDQQIIALNRLAVD